MRAVLVSYSGCVGRWSWVLVRVVIVVIYNLCSIPPYAIWMLLLQPLKSWHPELYWTIEGQLFHWLLAIVSLWSDSAGYHVAEVGDDITRCLNSRTLVIANHQSTADVPLLMAAFNARPGVLPRLMWIMDRIFKYTNFGIVSYLHGDFFIESGKSKRDASVVELKKHLREMYIEMDRKFIVLFPEGGFLRKRKETSQRYAEKNNLPALEHVSLPRVGALKVIIDEVGPFSKSSPINGGDSSMTEIKTVKSIPRERLEWILDVTIGYEGGKPIDLTNIVTGRKPPTTTQLHYRLYPSTDVPKDHEEMTRWLFKRFEEKEILLDHFYKKGCFPAECPDGVTRRDKSKKIEQDYFRFVYVTIFFVTSTFFHVYLFCSLFVFCATVVRSIGLTYSQITSIL